MDPLTNNNNNHHTADHEASTIKPIQNVGTTATHPLQDVPLAATTHETIPEMQQQEQQQKFQSKQNWVKFDDDVNEISSSSGGGGGGDGSSSIDNVGDDSVKNLTENNFNNNKQNYDQIDSTALPATNKLSALPTTPTALLPPPPQAAARPRSPHEREKTQSQLPREPVTISPLNTSPIPAQRSMVSSTTTTPAPTATATTALTTTTAADVAPAVLTTESTHVNLNASGKAQQQQQLQQQHHHLQQQSTLPQQQQQHQQQKSRTGGSQQYHQPLQAHHQTPGTVKATLHHNSNGGSSNNNGTTASTAPTTIPATTTTSGIQAAEATNNAMHHKSHHQQHSHVHPHTVNSSTALTVEPATSSAAATTSPPAMRTIELSTGRIREGFANGDVIVTLLPANTKWPWITPAIFRPELVPEELMAQGLTLTVEEYVQAMETLVNDYRFTVYNICYKRILICWIVLAFAVLLALLFSGLQGVALFSLGVGWLFLNAASIFVCMWVKLRLARGLEKCLARVNRQLMKHKILLILDDRGRISCHKVNLCFLYFDSTQCVNYLNEFLEHTAQNGGEEIKAGWESKLDIDLSDIVIQGSNPVRLSRKQEWGSQMFLRYSSRWGMEALRGLVDITPMEPGRHCGQFQCPCQYIKQHLECKPRGYPCSCIALVSDPHYQYGY